MTLDSTQLPTHITNINWQEFWFCPWLYRHDTWDNRFAMLSMLPDDFNFIKNNHQLIANYLGISIKPIQAVNKYLLDFASLSQTDRHYLLSLLVEIFQPNTVELETDTKRWCERIALGIRPNRWLTFTLDSHEVDVGSMIFVQWCEQQALWDRGCWLIDANIELTAIPQLNASISQIELLLGAVLARIME